MSFLGILFESPHISETETEIGLKINEFNLNLCLEKD